jgi:hypothetical protein
MAEMTSARLAAHGQHRSGQLIGKSSMREAPPEALRSAVLNAYIAEQ